MAQQIQLTPQEAANMLEQSKRQKMALEEVIGLKGQCLNLLDIMEEDIHRDDLAAALISWVRIQRIEYTLVQKINQQQLEQTDSIIQQLSSKIVIPRTGRA